MFAVFVREKKIFYPQVFQVTIDENDTNDEEEWKPIETFKSVFNKKTKDYVSIFEKSITGFIKFAQALGELGAMVDR